MGNRQRAIEPGGKLPDGSAFTNVQELKDLLMTHEDKLAKEILESLLAYALGRTIEFSDSDDIEVLLRKTKRSDYRVRQLVRQVALSELFLSK
ncbi:MAG: DUF1585 domain-containing protein [Verrucomicrobiota bacterium]